MGFRFFEGFEKTVCRGILHLVNVMNDDEAPLGFIGRKSEFSLQFADGVNFERGRVGLYFDEIGVSVVFDAITLGTILASGGRFNRGVHTP